MKEPLSNDDAKRLIRAVLATGEVSYSGHAYREMAKDKLTTVDCVNVLRGGWVEFSEFENGEWRYRVRTNALWVVVAFRSETSLRIVTAWRAR